MSEAPGSDASLDLRPVAEAWGALREQVSRVVIGQEPALRLAFITFLCGGHSLVEGVPGVAKTLLVKTLAASLELRFGRIQFTPDLMPSDIVGTPVLDARGAEFRFRPGPIFTDLLLADEINRASAKTQAALLEAMQEGAATVDGQRHPLGRHFAVFATQNPVDQEGTYPLPEAELDRFLFKIDMGYPEEADEVGLLERHHVRATETSESGPGPVLSPPQLDALRGLVDRVIVRREIAAYVSSLVRATRSDFQYALGASPRAGLWLLRAAKGAAALEGRDYVLAEDVQAMHAPTLRHRVLLDPAVEVEGLRPDEALERTLRTVTVPR